MSLIRFACSNVSKGLLSRTLFNNGMSKNGTILQVKLYTFVGRTTTPQLAVVTSSFMNVHKRTAAVTTANEKKPRYKLTSHANQWLMERIFSIALLGLLPAAFITQSRDVEAVAIVLSVIHMHWGLEAVVVDYIRESIFGSIIPKIAVAATCLFSTGVVTCLLLLCYYGDGAVKTIEALWHAV